MSVSEYIVGRANKLKAEQAHWENVWQQASAELLEVANRELAAEADEEREQQLRAAIEEAVAQLQEVKKELGQVSELLKTEGLRSEEQQKAEVAKELFDKKESEILEAFKQEERQKQEAAPRGPAQTVVEFVEAVAVECKDILADIAAQWAFVGQEFEKGASYVVSQTRDVVVEAAVEIDKAIANPVSLKEGTEFLQAQTQELANFIADEVFDTAPAAYKAMQLEHKIKEQIKAEEQTFGDRNDVYGIRKQTQEGLAELHDKLRDAVQLEADNEKKLHAEIKAIDEVHTETQTRLGAAGYPPQVLEEKTKRLDALSEENKQLLRNEAEAERRERSQGLESELRAITEDKRREMAGEAPKVIEAEELERETYRSL